MSTRALIATFIGLLVALAASLAIWRQAAIEPDHLRLALTLVPMVLWGLVPAIMSWARRHRTDTESRSMRARRKAVLGLLKPHKLAGRRSRYRVPLYLVIGAGGVGKSSLIADSGLAPDHGVRIDEAMWWVADNGIFVEVDAELATPAIVRLSALLTALRPKLPLNSILLVASPADLMLTDNIEYEALSRATTQAVRAIEAHTQRRYPLYALLTKTDLVPGFREYFDHREAQDCDRIWGFSLTCAGLDASPSRDALGAALTDGFGELMAALRARLVDQLSHASDPARSNRIHGFGVQVANLLPTVRPLLEALSAQADDLGRPGASLRGVFLTSSRQEGLSIDPLLPGLSARFAMPRAGMAPPNMDQDEAARDFFIKHVFTRVLQAEAGLALRHAPGRRRLLLQGIAVACIVALLFALGAWRYNRYIDARYQVARIQAIATELQPMADVTGQLTRIVANLKRLASVDGETPAVASLTLGLPGWHDHAPLSTQLAQARARLRQHALTPHLEVLLETQLVDPQLDAATRNARIKLASSLPQANDDVRRRWLRDSARALPPPLRQTFVKQGLKTLDADGGLSIDPAYINAARDLVAYRQARP